MPHSDSPGDRVMRDDQKIQILGEVISAIHAAPDEQAIFKVVGDAFLSLGFCIPLYLCSMMA